MSFAIPAALFLATLALPIIALYVLKVRFRQVPVTSNLFWKQVCEEKPPRAMWQQLRHWMSLLLQLVLLLLIVVAAADPVLRNTFPDSRRLVLILDNSASMQAADIVPTRLDAAKAAAMKLVDGLRYQDEMAIVAGGPHPEILTALTSDVRKLRDAIHQISFTDNPTLLSDAVALGQRMLGSDQSPDLGNSRVIVLTDGCLTDSDLNASGMMTSGLAADKRPSPRMEPIPVEYQLFATDSPNVGITRLQVRRSMADPLGYETFVVVKNASALPVSCRIELLLNDVPIDVIPMRLNSEETWSRSVSGIAAEGGVITARLTGILADDRDLSERHSTDSSSYNALSSGETAESVEQTINGLKADDQAWTVLSDRTSLKVLIISRGNLFLQKAFEAGSVAQVSVRRDFPETWPPDTLLVFHGQIPPQIPPGPVMVISPENNCDLWEVGEDLENPLVAEQDSESPLMTHVRLTNVQIQKSRRLRFRTEPVRLVTTVDGDALYAQVSRSEGRCLVLAVDLEDSDLAFRTTFPILVTNALTWFAGDTGDLQPVLRTGATGSLPLNAFRVRETNRSQSLGESDLRLQSPRGESQRVPLLQNDQTSAGVVRIGPLDEAGVWRLFPSGTSVSDSIGKTPTMPLAVVAVNLADDRETDLRPSKLLTESTSPVVDSARGISRPLWFFLAMVAILLMCVEWVLYQRRVIS